MFWALNLESKKSFYNINIVFLNEQEGRHTIQGILFGLIIKLWGRKDRKPPHCE